MVSEIAGTTRDSIEESVNIEGVIYRFVDTAGLHSTADRLEQMGIERTWKALEKAHIILCIADSADRDIEKDLCGFAPSLEQRIIHVINKIDLLAKEDQSITETQDKKYIPISAKLGLGIDKLLAELHTIADATNALRGDVIVSSQRHYEALRKAQESLVRSLDGLHDGTPTDLLSEDIRQVMYHIGTITGEINSEDILKSIFSSFCIGK